jgi:hypothetical protein
MRQIILILDLDGVLITTPTWKKDVMHADGYSDFNESCVMNLNQLLANYPITIFLSSTRRTVKTLDEFNAIFQNRSIKQKIEGFLPLYENKTRKGELEQFVADKGLKDFIIIDDDKSTLGLPVEIKQKLVHTNLLDGFTEEKLEEAIQIIQNNEKH